MRWPVSVRGRITVLATLVVAVALTAAAWGLLAVLGHSLRNDRDTLARARAETLAQQAAAGRLPRRITNVGEDGMAQVVAADGTVLAASSGLAGAGPVSRTPPASAGPELRVMHGVPDDSDVEDYRVWVLRASTAQGPVTVYIGASPESVREPVTTLRRSLLLGIPLLLVLVAFGARAVVGRALRPVEDLRREVTEISEHAAGNRLAVPATDDEVSRLAVTMNAMLARLEAALSRQRELVGDASHELQTPLTALRAQLEVALAHPDDAAWPTLAPDLLLDVEAMERLVRDLLWLARDDAGPQSVDHRLVDLDAVVLEEASRAAREGRRAGVAVDTSAVSAAPLRGSADELGRLVRNLLDNALAHASTTIRLSLHCDERTAYLEVRDDGPGIPADQRERVFERFARVDPGRARLASGGGVDGTDPSGRSDRAGRAGTGLGLAIARSIARRHGGDIRVLDTSAGARLAVELPVATS
ncbi:sensor histidine kinase [Nocardioides mesophilus]|uniref:histidine kinase n=1 Tax=Nocardioides mesophilus TaxID=433659 RepID=A0A7G9R9X1_9ACTN|nr:HAMP domain-containing sensor histidine kinase [Nocardioides mesophilus]QNN52396.1 HAMP domain-containing histidine kinase [Nocardioides mesophilus]